MRIFLAGATGVIGRRLVPLLVERGHTVTGLVRRSADADWLRSLGAKAVRGDVFDRDGVRRAVALAAPDVVMHQLTDLKGGNFRANSEMRTTGTRHLVDAALAAGVRRVVAQSIAWAYEAGSVPRPRMCRWIWGLPGAGCVRCGGWLLWRRRCGRRRSGWCCGTGCCTGPGRGIRGKG